MPDEHAWPPMLWIGGAPGADKYDARTRGEPLVADERATSDVSARHE
jgi:hypothetical protein